MSDFISRKLAIELLENTIAMTKKEERRRNYCVELIKAMPSAEPVRHGKWREYPISDGMNQCSKCGVLRFGKSNYCPNCGCRMDEDE